MVADFYNTDGEWVLGGTIQYSGELRTYENARSVEYYTYYVGRELRRRYLTRISNFEEGRTIWIPTEWNV